MTGSLAVEVLLAAVAGGDRTGPTIVFVLTIVIVLILFGTVARRASTTDRPLPSAPDEPQPQDVDDEGEGDAPADG